MGSHLRQKDITGTLFSQSLYYNDKRTNNTNEARYNGNISGMDWSADSKNRGYDFSYDALSRLTEARYLEGGARSDKFDTSYSYDRQGNVLTLSRRGNTGTTTHNTADNLTMNYMGNQLIRVEDTAANPSLSMSMDFKNGTSQEVEYSYDSNGNMMKDLNKGISSIEYNVLNLPKKVTFTGANNPVNEYVYSATGKKLAVIHKSSTNKRTDYVGNIIYENSSLKRVLVDGGYIENGVYHFFLQDHLGNNRIVAKADGTVVQTNHYYPYGMSFAESTQTSNQPYRYNGKELDTEYGLNLYDYEARYTNAALGRFTTVDPMAEKYYGISSYAYCLNNPVRFIDTTGKLVSPIYNEKGNLLGTDDEGLKGKAIIMNESNFKQGMSHEKALSYSLGYNGLISDEARSKYVSSYTSLKDRPDYDGYLTISEANKWYREGTGQPLFTSLEKIDLSGICSLGEKYIGQIKSFNLLLHSGSLNDGLVYGNITLKRYPNHSVRAFSDKYDFEMHNSRNPLNWGRNAETVIGRKVAGEGQSYEINIYGYKQLVPLLPWIK